MIKIDKGGVSRPKDYYKDIHSNARYWGRMARMWKDHIKSDSVLGKEVSDTCLEGLELAAHQSGVWSSMLDRVQSARRGVIDVWLGQLR